MKRDIRTSKSHPIRVDFLAGEVAPFRGRIGLTLAPGKYQPDGTTGHWERDLAADALALAEKGTRLLVSLIEDHELRALRIEGLVRAFEERGVGVLRLPFPDMGVPSLDLAKAAVTAVLDSAARGEDVVIHCMGGLGRTGLIAACALVAVGVDAESAMSAVRQARTGAIENRAQEEFVRAFAASGFRFAAVAGGEAVAASGLSAPSLQPLDRLRVSASELMASHPPRWRNANKQLVFEITSPPGSVHGGELDYSRWAAMSLPVRVDVRAAAARLRHFPGFYDYAATDASAVDWHVNFADASLFGYYAGALFAQDEMQTVEHPALCALREALLARGMKAQTEERGQPTPALVMGVERRCRVATHPDRDAGRPKGLYGNEFAAANALTIRRATERIDPPTVTNLIAIAAPRGGPGPYSKSEIERVLATAYSGFRAAVLESKRVEATIVHTGWWGCGAFGGNRILMAALQLLAAEMAEVHQLAFHSGGPGEEAPLNEALALIEGSLASSGAVVTTEALIERLTAMRFSWGVGNGT